MPDKGFYNGFTRRGFAAVAAAGFTEFAFAQRANVAGVAPKDTVWLNANEFPEGHPPAVLQAIERVIGETNRYHYREFDDFYKAVAASEKLSGDQVLIGAGSTEGLHHVVDVFTSPTRPFITGWPTFEAMPELAAVKGHAVVKIPLRADYTPDVKKLVAEAEKAGGGVIHICNPNNPTASVTNKQELAWLVDNLPPQTLLLVDEAYLHFCTSPDVESAMKYVRDGKNVIVTRTFSKIYGMAGLRAGFVAGRPDLIAKLAPYRNNVISIVAVRAILAAFDLGPKFIDERRDRNARTRSETTAWLKSKNVKFIEPHANFMMVDVRRNVKDVAPAMLAKSVAVGRAFPPYDTMMRVSVGTDAEMMKFRSVLADVMGV
jgi:histidinol-phosphate aminotransferase